MLMKGIIIGGILLELFAFWYIHQGKEPLVIADMPERQVSKLDDRQSPIAMEDSKVVEVSAAKPTPTLPEIKEKYRTRFEKLEAETRQKLQDFIGEVRDEISGSESGPAALLSIGSFYNEMKAIEKETDASFNEVYKQLENELELYGFSKEEAEEFRVAYEEKKEAIIEKFVPSTFE